MAARRTLPIPPSDGPLPSDEVSFIQDAELAALNYGTVRPVDVAHNTIPDPSQAVRLTVWESSTVYLTARETELVIGALQRALDKVRSLEE